MSYPNVVTQHLRLSVLQLLDQASGRDLNSDILLSALAQLGHRPSRDKLASELNWLAEQELITTATVGELTVSTLTARGSDIANDRTVQPGVARVRPV